MLVPRDYQVEAVSSLYNYFTTHPTGNPVLALPTGTGKAYVLALFLESAFRMYSKQKALVVTHVKELVVQDYNEFLELWPTAPAGVYSAGLKRKDTAQNIIFCGIASIIKNITAFGKVDLFLIDECHLLSQDDESMYLRAISILLKVNPNMKVIGLTATPWRAGQGKITDDGIFTDICFDVTNMHAFNRFIKEGYLAPLIPKRTNVFIDVSGVKLLGGDFNKKQLEIAADKDEVTWAAIQEAVLMGQDRHSWLVFGSGINHVTKIVKMLNYLGISARCVHSKIPEKERDQNIKDWKEGKFVAMVNNGILTTGLNHKPIDYIIMLRPTHSVVLWIQMLGRGTRPYDYLTEPKEYLREAFPYTKINCLVADFAQNTKRLGPINDPVVPRKRGEKTGEIPIKICEPDDGGCGAYNHISARFCGGEPFKTAEGCGHEFIFKTLMKAQASTEVLIRTDVEEPICANFNVETVTYQLHKKAGKPDCMKVTYWCGLQNHNEYVLFEHEGFGQRKARMWWKERSNAPCPTTTHEALMSLNSLRAPMIINVWLNTKYPVIMKATFKDAYDQEAVAFNIEDIPM